jgi:cytochrome c biogenesis protein CcmG/thiol:disulfide interchange protein DsbE
VLSAGFGRDPTVVQSVLLDRPAPPLEGAALGGDRFDLRDHRGKVVLVNVWASWCVPCRQEYPVLEEADRELGTRGLRVVGINTQDSEAEAQAFLDELGGENFLSVVDPDGRIAVEWGTFGVPETFVVDRDGRLRAKVVGAVTREWIVSNVVPLLDQP